MQEPGSLTITTEGFGAHPLAHSQKEQATMQTIYD